MDKYMCVQQILGLCCVKQNFALKSFQAQILGSPNKCLGPEKIWIQIILFT